MFEPGSPECELWELRLPIARMYLTVIYYKVVFLMLIVHCVFFFWIHFQFFNFAYRTWSTDSKQPYYAVIPLLELIAVFCGLSGHYHLATYACDSFDCGLGVVDDVIEMLFQTTLDLVALLDLLLCFQRVFVFFEIGRFYTDHFKWVVWTPTVAWVFSVVVGQLVFSIRNYFDYFRLPLAGARCLLSAACLAGYGGIILGIRIRYKASSTASKNTGYHLSIVYQALPITIFNLGFAVQARLFAEVFEYERAIDFLRVHLCFLGDAVPMSFLAASTERRAEFLQKSLVARLTDQKTKWKGRVQPETTDDGDSPPDSNQSDVVKG